MKPEQVQRRWFLEQCGVGLGSMALHSLFAPSAAAAADPVADDAAHQRANGDAGDRRQVDQRMIEGRIGDVPDDRRAGVKALGCCVTGLGGSVSGLCG